MYFLEKSPPPRGRNYPIILEEKTASDPL